MRMVGVGPFSRIRRRIVGCVPFSLSFLGVRARSLVMLLLDSGIDFWIDVDVIMPLHGRALLCFDVSCMSHRPSFFPRQLVRACHSTFGSYHAGQVDGHRTCVDNKRRPALGFTVCRWHAVGPCCILRLGLCLADDALIFHTCLQTSTLASACSLWVCKIARSTAWWSAESAAICAHSCCNIL